MNEVQEIYLNLLRAALWGEEVTSEWVNGLRGEQVNALIRLAAFQGTGPLIYDQLLKLKDAEISPALRMQMKQQCLHSMMLQQSTVPLLRKAWKILENAKIYPVLLKGFGLAQYYPQPHLRQWGDIDIYVGQKNYHSACVVLRNTFPDAEYGKVEDDEDKHYNFVFPNTAIETHRVSMTFAHPRDRRYYEELEAKCLTKDGPKFEVEGLELTMPEETFNVFFVFLHAWYHFIGTGMNMKQLCDIAIMLHTKRDVIEKERLKEMLTKLRLMEVWQLIMYIMVHQLGVLQNECPFYNERSRERAELLFERVMSEGSARNEESGTWKAESGMSYLKRKWITFQERIASSRFIKQYAPRYARHMVISAFIHGIERTIKRK